MALKTIQQFDSETYYKLFSHFNSYDRKLVSVFKSLLNFEPSCILDLACGVGFSTMALEANFPNARITGVDIDANMIELAQKGLPGSNLEFQCCDISLALDNYPANSTDIIFVKSAYHYFDHQVTLSHLQPKLSNHGVVVVAERTSRSAASYPLPDIVSSYWKDIFSEIRENQRFKAADLHNVSLSVTCYGEYVTLPSEIYYETVKQKQLVGIWMLNTDMVDEWLSNQLAKKVNTITVFEEFWLYLYKSSK